MWSKNTNPPKVSEVLKQRSRFENTEPYRALTEHDGMTITEALKSRTAEKPFITRKSWSELERKLEFGDVSFLRASNSPDACIYHSRITNTAHPKWAPTEEDLLATDWELVALNISSIERI